MAAVPLLDDGLRCGTGYDPSSPAMEFTFPVPEGLSDGDKLLSPLQQPPAAAAAAANGRPVLTKQASQRMMNCLCSPTTHVGSFRCRHHRSASLLRSGVSVGSGLSAYGNDAAGGFSPKMSELGDKVASGGASVRV